MPDPIEPRELQPNELPQRFAQFLESNEIAYRVVGSMGIIAYGENPFTNAIDIVAELRLEHIDCRPPLTVHHHSKIDPPRQASEN